MNTIRNGAPSTPAASEIADEPDYGGVTIGGSVSGVIDENGDVDYYTVNLVAGQTYSISLRGPGATPINDSLLTLFGPAGPVVAHDDDGGNALYSLLTFTVTEPGPILSAPKVRQRDHGIAANDRCPDGYRNVVTITRQLALSWDDTHSSDERRH